MIDTTQRSTGAQRRFDCVGLSLFPSYDTYEKSKEEGPDNGMKGYEKKGNTGKQKGYGERGNKVDAWAVLGKKYLGGGTGPSPFGRQQRLSEI